MSRLSKNSEYKPVPQICKNCRFWGPTSKDEFGPDRAQCHRYPPTSQILEGDLVVAYPVTEWRDWCGDFAVRIDA